MKSYACHGPRQRGEAFGLRSTRSDFVVSPFGGVVFGAPGATPPKIGVYSTAPARVSITVKEHVHTWF
jgi:hypothetical protein